MTPVPANVGNQIKEEVSSSFSGRGNMEKKPLQSVRQLSRLRIRLGEKYSENIRRAAEAAMNGDAQAALQLADITNPLGTHKLINTEQLRVPAEMSADRFFWLRLAADLGNPEAQVSYVNDALTLSGIIGPERYQKLDPKFVDELRERSISYINSTLNADVPDIYLYIDRIFRHGDFGFPVNVSKAHACLMQFASKFDGDIPIQLLEASQARLKTAELNEAQRIFESGTACSLAP